jgi:hypothetical protein
MLQLILQRTRLARSYYFFPFVYYCENKVVNAIYAVQKVSFRTAIQKEIGSHKEEHIVILQCPNSFRHKT